MRRLRSFFALLLLALWLPATLHCDLEAAGVHLIDGEDHASSVCEDNCVQDSCPTVEDVSYAKGTTVQRALPPPGSVVAVCWLDLIPPQPVEPAPPAFRVREPSAVQLLHRTWSFVRRSALPARAPAIVV